jgi:hypothetical protein
MRPNTGNPSPSPDFLFYWIGVFVFPKIKSCGSTRLPAISAWFVL